MRWWLWGRVWVQVSGEWLGCCVRAGGIRLNLMGIIGRMMLGGGSGSRRCGVRRPPVGGLLSSDESSDVGGNVGIGFFVVGVGVGVIQW